MAPIVKKRCGASILWVKMELTNFGSLGPWAGELEGQEFRVGQKKEFAFVIGDVEIFC